MPEFLQLIESIQSDQASVQRLFGSEQGEVSLRESRHRQGVAYKARLLEAATFTREIFEGKRPIWQLREALSTSDFPLLFGDTLERLVLQDFQAAPSDWTRFLRTGTVPDFRSVKRLKLSDGDQRLNRVAEGESYPAGDRDEAAYTFSVNKYGRVFHMFWEALINDDLDALRNLPSVMSRAARRTEDYFASSLYVANTTLFTAEHGNKGTAPLSLAALKAAYQAMAGFRDENGEPIFNRPVYLVVDPVQYLDALELVGSMQIQWAGGAADAGAVAVAYPTENVMRGRLTVLEDPYMSLIDTTNGDTSWYLLADPRNGYVAEVARLRGYEQPQLFMKTANAVRVGGGPVDPTEGDFDTDSVHYKVRHVIGGSHANAVGGWRFGYWSDGTGA